MNPPGELVEFDRADAARVAGWSTSAEDSFFWCGQEVELARLIVAPTARGRGLGRRLLSALAAEAGHTGVPLVFLRVNPANAPALRCYSAAGWREVDDATAAGWNAEQPVAYRWFVLPDGAGLDGAGLDGAGPDKTG